MKTALRWTRRVLLADLAAIAFLILTLIFARVAGVDVILVKWPSVLLGAVLTLIAGVLSVAALVLQIVVAAKRRPRAS